MKIKFSIIALLLFGSILSTNAQQQQRSPEERAKMTVARISDSLGLDKSQAEKTTIAMTDYFVSMQKMRESLAPGTRPEPADMEKLTKSRDEQLAKILTPAQLLKYKDMEERMRQERMKSRGGQ